MTQKNLFREYDDPVLREQFSAISGPSPEFRAKLRKSLLAEAEKRGTRLVFPSNTFWRRVGSLAAAVILVSGLSLFLNNGSSPAEFGSNSTSPVPSVQTFQTDASDPAQGTTEEGNVMVMVEEEKAKAEISQEDAVEIAKQQVSYPARVLDVTEQEIDGKAYWKVALVRDGIGIPNRDDILIDITTGEAIVEMSAQ